jgi:hypothetical protein
MLTFRQRRRIEMVFAEKEAEVELMVPTLSRGHVAQAAANPTFKIIRACRAAQAKADSTIMTGRGILRGRQARRAR